MERVDRLVGLQHFLRQRHPEQRAALLVHRPGSRRPRLRINWPKRVRALQDHGLPIRTKPWRWRLRRLRAFFDFAINDNGVMIRSELSSCKLPQPQIDVSELLFYFGVFMANLQMRQLTRNTSLTCLTSEIHIKMSMGKNILAAPEFVPMTFWLKLSFLGIAFLKWICISFIDQSAPIGRQCFEGP